MANNVLAFILPSEPDIVSKTIGTGTWVGLINPVTDYLFEISQLPKRPKEFFIGLSGSKILVWAVVENGDESTEDNLLLAEAKVNSKYYGQGIYLTSILVEESEKMDLVQDIICFLGSSENKLYGSLFADDTLKRILTEDKDVLQRFAQ